MNVGKLFYNNKFVVVFSIFASFVAWCIYSVSINNNRNIKNEEKKIIKGVAIELEVPDNLKKNNYKIIFANNNEKRAEVTVQGDRITTEKLDAKDIKIVGVPTRLITNPDEFEIQLNPKKNNNSDNYEIKSVYPEKIKIAMDKEEEKKFDIESGIEYKIEDGFFAEKPQFTPENIVIKGPKFIIDKISKIIAIGKIEGPINRPQDVNTSIEIYDKNNKKINFDFLDINSSNPRANINVLKKKNVPVTIKSENGPSDKNFLNSILKKNIENADITGTGTNLENVNEINVIVDFSNINLEKKMFKAKFESNSQQYKIEFFEEVDITFNTENLSSKKIICDNFEDRDNVEIVKKPISVEIIGPKKTLENLNLKNIKIIPNLKSIKNVTGEQEIEVKIQIDQNSDCWAFGKYTIHANIH